MHRSRGHHHPHNGLRRHQDYSSGSSLSAGGNFNKEKHSELPYYLSKLQLSEVIARARKYHQEVTGEKGPIIEGHVDKETFKQDLAEAGVEVEKPAVKEFLEHMTHDQRGIINMFDWKSILNIDMDDHLQEKFQVPNLMTGRMEPLISDLTDEEEEQFRNCIQRMNTLFTAAKELDVRVMVDAEQTYFQPAISRITMEMMKKYNTQKAIVFNTYQVCHPENSTDFNPKYLQCYLKDAYKMLLLDLEQANRQNFFFGAKLVRGAYMEQVTKHTQSCLGQ